MSQEITKVVDDSLFRIALAWQLKGKYEFAAEAYRKVLANNPEFVQAYKNLGSVMGSLRRFKEAIGYYEKALELDPNDEVIESKCHELKRLVPTIPQVAGNEEASEAFRNGFYIPERQEGKINLYRQKTFLSHRSGWEYALRSLRPLHNSQGILFDGFIENNFAWRHEQEGVRPSHVLDQMEKTGKFSHWATSEEKGITPYRRPWIGILHNPQGMPRWFHYRESPQAIMSKTIWKDSLAHCIGLFTFSEYHARWLRKETGKPVERLIHPTEIPELQFDFDKFLNNHSKKIIQIGWWLRKLHSIYLLPIPQNNPHKYEKIHLIPMFSGNALTHIHELMHLERKEEPIHIAQGMPCNTREIVHVTDRDYDELLSENIVFIELYDANANNAVIECLARTTPILINPLPAVKEYLGDEYPLYYDSLDEAADKALDLPLISEAHQYLKTLETRNMLDGNWFLRSVQTSHIYQLI
jgi:tetratricopeptide (TPR) repeat protein